MAPSPSTHPQLHRMQSNLMVTIDTYNEHNEAEGSNLRSHAHKESEKMQTGSFKAAAEGLEPSSMRNTADMKNVTAMLFRAMSCKGEEARR